MKKQLRWLSIAVGTLIAAGCATGIQNADVGGAANSVAAARPKTITETAAAMDQLSTLSGLLSQTGLADTLSTAGPYTLFAPTNEAFLAMPAASLDALSKDADKLKAVLSYHVLPGKLMSETAKNESIVTLQGEKLAVSRSGSFVTVENAMVVGSDVETSNGVVHLIDRVLMPPPPK